MSQERRILKALSHLGAALALSGLRGDDLVRIVASERVLTAIGEEMIGLGRAAERYEVMTCIGRICVDPEEH